MCPTILDNKKTYLSKKWIFDDKNVIIVCVVERKLDEWIKLFRNTLYNVCAVPWRGGRGFEGVQYCRGNIMMHVGDIMINVGIS